MGRSASRSLLVLLLAAIVPACGADEDEARKDPDAWRALGITRSEEEFDEKVGDLASVPVDPPPVVGEDYHPTFPPPIPFVDSEWKTTIPSPSVADPRALKGGKLRLAWTSWPPTLRTEGPNARLSTLSDLQYLVYETLLVWDPVLEDYAPGLATHWRILPDRMTYRFRLDARARWADGRKVTADDVVATLEHLRNPDRRDPSSGQWRERIRYAKALDELTVEVQAREPRWRILLEVGTTLIYPAAYIRMDGETYLDAWNWKLPPGSGPYELRTDDVRKGRSVTLRRRKDWWAAARPENAGWYNFDEIEWQVVRDEELQYAKMLADELDIYLVSKAQRWVEELDREEKIRKGWIQKRKIFSRCPEGLFGYCFNLRAPPFDRRDVRLAFAHLLHREMLFAKFFFYQYEYEDSYWPGQPWARPNAERVHYDPVKARELLAAEGWTRRDADGHLVNERGERFPKLLLEFDDYEWERIHSVYKTDLWDEAGIELELKYLDYTSLLKKQWEYRFTLTFTGWTEGLFPDPEFSYHSKYADVPQSNNWNGFKDPAADRIMDAYKVEFDAKRRRELLQELDRILFDEHLYALTWYAPFFRIIYWDRFGHPAEYATRDGRDITNVLALWWFDPEKDARRREAMAANRGLYPDRKLNQAGEVDARYWLTHELPMSRETDR